MTHKGLKLSISNTIFILVSFKSGNWSGDSQFLYSENEAALTSDQSANIWLLGIYDVRCTEGRWGCCKTCKEDVVCGEICMLIAGMLFIISSITIFLIILSSLFPKPSIAEYKDTALALADPLFLGTCILCVGEY